MKGPGLTGPPLDPAWVPSEAVRQRSRLLKAMESWGINDLRQLHQRSVDDPDWFWRAAAEDLDVTFSTPFEKVIDESLGKQFPQWFTGGRLNAATLCAHRHARGRLANKVAVVYEGDKGQERSLTYSELSEQVTRFAGSLQQLGVRAGDRIVLFLPVVPEAVVAFLGCAMIGAISVPAFTGYGAEALATRLRDSEAVAMVTADGTTRRGKPISLKRTADEALRSAPSVKHVIVVKHLSEDTERTDERDIFWDELPTSPNPVQTREMASNDPLTIIYTSGTTGMPKGIVHSHAGFTVKAAIDFAYGFDVQEDDVIAWIADMGWMLGPLLIMGGLQLGATIVLTEGVPDYPVRDRLWDVARRHRVTLQGIAPTAARGIAASGQPLPEGLDAVRAFASTGEGWDEQTWRWLFERVGGSRRPIVNYSGGTETGGGILISYPFLPSEAAAFNGPLPGMDVAVLDAKGELTTDHLGELTVCNTWPGMTHAFWNDRDRYLKTYWERWNDIWFHGDLASIDTHGTWRLHGRSDDTIKVSGRRVGPAEIEAALLKDSSIREAAVIGVPDENRGQRVVAFVIVAPDVDVDEVKTTAEHNVGRAFAPVVHVVSALPKTTNGKVMRRAIRAWHLDESPGDLSALDPSTPIDAIPRRHDQGRA